ncbi:hypothetical protein SERLA73DRAFT_71480 [Serpula lacrymans var. lacrymans S7.3]|uniref:Uncharacterized protein n=2 Tax=Serpula lacrymans var. lacrymans TaxID=341189 RepID=F8PR63_SERL3|nr:uncharacterized protein SERLADRAFT_435857 [Serpula lacrymans var. lacrymans S7.9]EGO02354.1 hypothetical protein SERLA73DRAFT_71480 [Serpula lacrymans var. lacrymans S7.3]EGO28088.1 hypothetical protein SERLADRAFT_435857 [Serpula lacrymans var. lacrymans S7.9]
MDESRAVSKFSSQTLYPNQEIMIALASFSPALHEDHYSHRLQCLVPLLAFSRSYPSTDGQTIISKLIMTKAMFCTIPAVTTTAKSRLDDDIDQKSGQLSQGQGSASDGLNVGTVCPGFFQI